MSGEMAMDIARDAIFTLLLVSLPLMLVALFVGLLVSIFQALTQLQEMTLTFVPKILVVFITLFVALPFMVDQLSLLTLNLADTIVAVGGK